MKVAHNPASTERGIDMNGEKVRKAGCAKTISPDLSIPRVYRQDFNLKVSMLMFITDQDHHDYSSATCCTWHQT